MKESPEKIKIRTKKIIKWLKKNHPDAKCSLEYKSPWELVAATILSAQCTDERVNKTTPALFKKFKDPQSMAAADLNEIEGLVRSTGFFRNKAKSLKECAGAVVTKFGGHLPSTLSELTTLRGVGRKTANVVLGNAFGKPAMVVDTHVTRLTNRMGLTMGKDAVKLEFQLMDFVEKKEWTIFSHLLISHGRSFCQARSPRCGECGLQALCPKVGVDPKSYGTK